MSSIFSKPRAPKLPPQTPEPEPMAVVEEDAGKAGRRERKRLLRGGRMSTILSGIQSALKKRLGE